MPVRPENRDRYPADWPTIRERVRARAGDKCEWCGVPNHSLGYRRADGVFEEVGDEVDPFLLDGVMLIDILCTVAHLNHRPEDCRDENLRFLCQQCHNRHDAGHRAATRARTRDEKNGQRLLLEMEA